MDTIQVRNPRNGQFDYEFVPPEPDALQRRAGELRKAQTGWAAAPGRAARRTCCSGGRSNCSPAARAIVEALATDTGRHLLAQAEFGGTVAAIDRWCAQAPRLVQEHEGRSQAQPSITFRSQLVPYPLVGVISPWNFPLTLSLIDAIPALLAGCAVLVKPSEVTPRFVEPLQAQPSRPCPSSRRCSISSWATAGRARRWSASSTSSASPAASRPGARSRATAAEHFIPAFLELGGKDPVIVTETADLELATDVVLRASVLATGQACQSLERVYVQDSHLRSLRRAAGREGERGADQLPGHPRRHRRAADLRSPGRHHRGADRRRAAARRAECSAAGGSRSTAAAGAGSGRPWSSTSNHSMQLMTEETFGPVMPVMTFHTVDEAVELANDGVYGLSAAVIAGTLEEAEAIGRRIDAGAVSLNDGSLTGVMHEAEKNSFKCSGLGGSRMGAAGLTRFFRKKALIRQTGRPGDDRHVRRVERRSP